MKTGLKSLAGMPPTKKIDTENCIIIVRHRCLTPCGGRMDEGYNINEVSRVLNVILDARETGATRLKVMAELFLSDRVAKSYIDLIIRAGLIDSEVEMTFYKITNAGREWLEENGK